MYSRAGLLRITYAASAYTSGLRAPGPSPRRRRAGSAPPRWPPASAATACWTRCRRSRSSSAIPKAHNDIPYLAIMYAVGLSHFGLQPDRRRQRQDVRVVPALHVRDARLRHRVGAAHLDAVHQVEPLERHLGDRAEVDRRGVVHADVDAAELFDGLGHRGGHRVAVADVADDRQRLPAGLLDLLGGGVHRARQLGVRLGGLGDQRDVGAVGGAALLAIASPMPRLAPEMNMVLPGSDMGLTLCRERKRVPARLLQVAAGIPCSARLRTPDVGGHRVR